MKKRLKKLRTDWLTENIVKTLPMFIALNLVALVIWQLNISHSAMPLMLGVIAGGLVDLDSSLSGKFKNLLLSLLAFALSSFGAKLSLAYGWIFIPAAVVSTFVLVMLGAVGQRYSTIAFGTLVVSVYTSLTYVPTESWYGNILMILTGALIYGVVGMLVHLCFPNLAAQENLARAYAALARYLQAKSAYFDPDDDDLPAKQMALAKANREVIQAFEQTRVSLFYRLQGHNRHRRTRRLLRYYFTAQEVLERAGSSHYQYHELFRELGNSDLMFRFQRVMELQANACGRIADSLRRQEAYRHGNQGGKALLGLMNSLRYQQEHGLKSAHRWRSIAENLQNIETRLSRIVQENEADDLRRSASQSPRLKGENVSGAGNMLQAIVGQCTLSSQLFRHALRLSVVVGFCSALVPLFGLDGKGYWILLTAVFVCQPNYSATKKRLSQRVFGTILGVLVGMLLREYYFTSKLEAQLGLMVLTGSLYTFFRFRNYGFSTFYITLLVLVSLEITGIGADEGMLPRIVDTLIGTALAWAAVSFIYPDWKYLNLRRNLQSVLKSSGIYLRYILAQLQFGHNNQLAYRMARRDVHNTMSALSAVISDMSCEPQKYRRILTFAPQLLGLTSSLLSYISALGVYRSQSAELNRHIEFSALFFRKGRQVADILDDIAQAGCDATALEHRLVKIERALAAFERDHQEKEDTPVLILIRQLRMIMQLLPQLQMLLGEGAHMPKTI